MFVMLVVFVINSKNSPQSLLPHQKGGAVCLLSSPPLPLIFPLRFFFHIHSFASLSLQTSPAAVVLPLERISQSQETLHAEDDPDYVKASKLSPCYVTYYLEHPRLFALFNNLESLQCQTCQTTMTLNVVSAYDVLCILKLATSTDKPAATMSTSFRTNATRAHDVSRQRQLVSSIWMPWDTGSGRVAVRRVRHASSTICIVRTT